MMLIIDTAMEPVFKEMTASIRNGCLLLIPLLFVFKTAWSLVKGFTGDQHVHYQGLFGAVLLWLLVASYSDLMGYMDLFCQGIINFIEPPQTDPVRAVAAVMYARNTTELVNAAGSVQKGLSQVSQGQIIQGAGSTLSSVAGYFIKSVKDAGTDFIAGLLTIFASLARMVIETVRALLLKFLIAIGPIALSLSIIDGFGNISRHWFQKLLSVYCWSLTLNILDRIIIGYFTQVALVPEAMILNGTPVNADTPYFMDQLIVGGMYMMVPWLTGSFLGGVNAGLFLDNKVKLLSTMVSTVVGSAKSLTAGK